MRPSNKKMLKLALKIAKSGQPVFPCKATGSKAKAPYLTNGFLGATTDPKKITAWWGSMYKGAAIGIPTGIKDDVLDVDVKNGVDGRVHLVTLQNLGLLNGCRRVVKTPSGGWHLYFPPNPELRNHAKASLGLDVRAVGGYVLAPGSFIRNDEYAGLYVDHGQPEGGNKDPLLWDLIRSALEPRDVANEPIAILPSERRASLASLREWVANLQPGERNNGLHWAVCRCLESRLDPNELFDPAILAGLTEDEANLTIRAAIKRSGLTAKDFKTEADLMFGDL